MRKVTLATTHNFPKTKKHARSSIFVHSNQEQILVVNLRTAGVIQVWCGSFVVVVALVVLLVVVVINITVIISIIIMFFIISFFFNPHQDINLTLP